MIKFSDDQMSIIEGFMESFNSQTLYCIPAKNKNSGNTDIVITILETKEDTEVYSPIGILFNPGEEVFDRFDFGLDFSEETESNIVYSKPSFWEKLRSYLK